MHSPKITLGRFLFISVLAVHFLAVAMASCTHYNPALYPSYDVLNPGPEVRLNPLSATADGNYVVNPAFIAWVEELKQEVIKLRKSIK